MKSYKNVDEYIDTFPKDIQNNLQKLRKAIQKAAPDATEKIGYGIPTFVLHGNLVHFAAFKDHYSFFPASSGINAFKKELGPYITGKGTVSFPLDKPLPLELIARVVKFRVIENTSK